VEDLRLNYEELCHIFMLTGNLNNTNGFFSKVNHTKQDWQLIASVEGEGFYGPPVMVAKACLTSYYPLMFRPTSEDSVKVLGFIFQATVAVLIQGSSVDLTPLC
jgi:hypothetical protein